VATGTFNTSVTDASGYTTLSSGVEASTGAAFWNGKYRSNPIGVSEGGGLSFRSVIKVPIDFSTLTGAVQITAATLQMRYFDTGATFDQVRNTGSRTVNIHRLLVSFTESPGTDSATGWSSSSTQNWNTKLKTAGTHYDATVLASKSLTTAVSDKTLHEYDILEFIKKIAPASVLVGATTGVAGEAQPNNGLLLKMSSTNSSQAAEYYSREGAAANSTTGPTIVLTYTTNTAPNKPVPTSPLSLALQSGDHVNFTATHSDPDAGDLPSKFDLEISKNADWSSPIFASSYVTTTTPLTASVLMTNFDSNIDYFWRVRSYDTAGVAGPWSDLSTASFTAPTNTIGFPPPEGNPNFATTTTIARNKYRLEFYPLLASLNGFDPKPSAVVFDADKIGVSQSVNEPGEFFFTLQSDHPQIKFIIPQKTFWRACRWDETKGYFRVLSEGLVTRSVSYANRVTFYGIDKLGMTERTMVSTEFTGEAYSHVDVTLANLHDSIMARNVATATVTGTTMYPTSTVTGVTVPAPATITGISSPVVGTVRFTAANTFWVGGRVSMTGITPSNYNLKDQIITAVTSTYFEIANFTTTTYTSGGTATSGTVRFTANNVFSVNDVVTMTAINPTSFNLEDKEIKAVTATTFDVWDAATGTYVSGGVATPSKNGIIRYTAANTFFNGQVVSITGVTPSDFNLSLKTIVERDAAWFEVKDPFIGTYTSGGTVTPAKTIMDMGWGESPATFFRDYSVTNGANATATAKKSVTVAGQQAVTALSAMADVLMAGTTDRVIVENPNIGLPAAKIDTMSVGLRHRHLTAAQVTTPNWWLRYGTNVKRYAVNDNLDQMATRASVINTAFVDSDAVLSAYNGDTDAALYAQYALIDKIERTDDERNDIDFSAQLQYNLQPDRIFSIEVDVIPNTIIPHNEYVVGDDINVNIVDDQVNIKKPLTLVAQQWIGNSNGSEYLAFGFSQVMNKSFIKPEDSVQSPTEPTPPPATATTPSSVGTATYNFMKTDR